MIFQFESYLLKILAYKNWKLFLALFLPLVVLFFAIPSLKTIPENWDPILVQLKNPIQSYVYPDHLYASKLAFRFVPAFIIGWLHLDIIGILVWQYIISILLFYVIGYMFEIQHDNDFVTLCAILITTFNLLVKYHSLFLRIHLIV